MQISHNLHSNINFQKKLKANCAVVKEDKPINCKIYQLEKDKDEDYFKDLKNTTSWIPGVFTEVVATFIKNETIPIDEVHVIEDKKGKCLGYCQITDDDPYETTFTFLESIPKGLFNQDYKYIGETLLTYMAMRAKENSKESVVAEDVAKKAENFYKSHNFYLIPNDKFGGVDGFLDEENYGELLNKNKTHTTKSIELIG